MGREVLTCEGDSHQKSAADRLRRSGWQQQLGQLDKALDRLLSLHMAELADSPANPALTKPVPLSTTKGTEGSILAYI